MKLIIQIPCYNEEQNLEKTLKALPQYIEGIDEIEYLVINDGSTDRTKEIAIEQKVHHIIDIQCNKGLANAFTTGIDECIKNGADIIVNIDGDNQYSGQDIPKLIEPIIKREAEMVIGEREINKFSLGKRILQRTGSFVVRKVSNTKVPDAPSGFRAYSRDCAMRLNVYNQFTYTLETIIQAGKNKTKIKTIKIHSNPDTRKSRLFKNVPEYIRKSLANMIKAVFIYNPIKTFLILGIISLLIATVLIILNKILFGIILIILGGQLCIAAMQSISIQSNRRMLENIQYQIKKEIFQKDNKSKLTK